MKKDKEKIKNENKKSKKIEIQPNLNNTWIIDYTYYKNEIVVYNNLSYIALKETVGDYPNLNPKYWKIMEI